MSSPAYLAHASLQSSSNSMKPRRRASSSACLQIKSGMSDGPMTNPFRWHKADGCDRARRCLRRHTGSAPPRCESPHLPASSIAVHVPSSRPTPDTTPRDGHVAGDSPSRNTLPHVNPSRRTGYPHGHAAEGYAQQDRVRLGKAGRRSTERVCAPKRAPPRGSLPSRYRAREAICTPPYGTDALRAHFRTPRPPNGARTGVRA